jgi:hypothetical protein
MCDDSSETASLIYPAVWNFSSSGRGGKISATLDPISWSIKDFEGDVHWHYFISHHDAHHHDCLSLTTQFATRLGVLLKMARDVSLPLLLLLLALQAVKRGASSSPLH